MPHAARVWNYWLGGRDNYEADRVIGGRMAGLFPQIVDLARAERAFLNRSVRFLAGEAGVRQFLDIGTGLPTHNNTHEVAQRVAPESRIVYVDNDALVLVHARALLTSSVEGATDHVLADLRDTDVILEAAARTLDFSRPIAIMLLGVLHFITDYEESRRIVDRLIAAVPPGSYIAVACATSVIHGAVAVEAARRWNEVAQPKLQLRSPEQIRGFFEGVELLEPGVVSCSRWRPAPGQSEPPDQVDQFCAVGRVPGHIEERRT